MNKHLKFLKVEYNDLLRKYKSCLKRYHNLLISNRNVRRQSILLKHVERLFKKLSSIRLSFQKISAFATFAIGAFFFSPTIGKTQSFAPDVLNPYGLTTNGATTSAPVMVDLDADGDLDVLSGNYSNFYYYQNTGSTTAPTFAPVVTNPFGLTTIPASGPSFADLDNDGDLDMISGQVSGAFRYFQNTGTASAPMFAAPVTNPFSLTTISFRQKPEFVDLDADGDFDIMAGDYSGNLKYFQNVGTVSSPSFAAVQTNPFSLPYVPGLMPGTGSPYVEPTFGDLDGDGDLDLLVGSSKGQGFCYLQNTGTVNTPIFASGLVNPYGLTGGYWFPSPDFGDLNGDGLLDVLGGSISTVFHFFRNNSPCIADKLVSASVTSFNCTGSTDINVSSSQTGVEYYLRNDSNNSIITGPILGNGNTIALNTGTITSSTTYNVIGVKENYGVALPNGDDHIRFGSPFSAYGNEITVEANVFSILGEYPWAGQSSASVDNGTTNVWLWHGGTFYVNDGGIWRSVVWPTMNSGWTHVSTVANTTGLYVYYDGILVASSTTGVTTGIVNNSSSIIDLGHDPRFNAGTLGRNSNTPFDNFRVWNVAKTATEIANEMDICLAGTETDLVVYSELNDGTGVSITSIAGPNSTIINPSTNWISGNGVCGSCTAQMTQTATVNVVDNVPTVATTTGNISVNVDAGTCGAVVNYTAPTFDDDCDGSGLSGTLTAGLNSGSTFNSGVTTVTYEYTDAMLQTVSSSFTVTVTDNLPPVISNCPSDINITTNNSGCTALANWVDPSATDNCTASPIMNASHTTSFAFPIGTTVVSYDFEDSEGNIATCTFDVTVSSDLSVSAAVSSNYNGEDISCNGGTDGLATATVTGGSSPFSYSWTTGGTNSTEIGLDAGSTTVTVTDVNGCVAMSTAVLTEPTALTGSGTSTDEINGNDGTIDLTVSGGLPTYTYAWTGPNSFTGNTEDLSGLEAGTYDVTISDLNGCTTTVQIVVSSQVGINEMSSFHFSIYPNPSSNGLFNLSIPNLINENVKVEIMSTIGSIVFATNVSNANSQINLGELATGTYFIRLNINDQIRTEKISIIR